jgi:RNA polymerase sigma-32 factor
MAPSVRVQRLRSPSRPTDKARHARGEKAGHAVCKPSSSTRRNGEPREAHMALVNEVQSDKPTEVREGPLTPTEEQRLARRWRTLEDPDALKRLVAAHLGLVVKIAADFRGSGPSLEDLIQEGNVGLTIAARRFDPAQGTRLATYATYWIRACMMEHVVRSHGPVRIGTTRSQRKIFFGLGRARRRLERGGEPAATAQLAAVLGVEEEEVASMVPRLTGRDLSLDEPRSSDDGRQVGTVLAEPGPSPEEMVAGVEEHDRRRARLHKGLKVLDPRERAILRARHLSSRPATLAALGKKFHISRERVRQLELRAVAKLRVYFGVDTSTRTPVFHAA